MHSTQCNTCQGSAEDQRAEYAALRAEILYSDQICIIITGALLSGSLALVTFVIETLNQPDLLALLSPVWLIGHIYISEKRFVIETIALYMRQKVEKQSGFWWESWLNEERQGRSRFRRIFPYHIETIMSVVVICGLPFFIVWNTEWRAGWGYWVSIFFMAPMALAVYVNLRAYAKRGQTS
jgi:hypothetical protein